MIEKIGLQNHTTGELIICNWLKTAQGMKQKLEKLYLEIRIDDFDAVTFQKVPDDWEARTYMSWNNTKELIEEYFTQE